jgi:hypothetical protein
LQILLTSKRYFNRDEQELLGVTGFGQGGPLVQNAALNAEPSVEGL